MTFDNRPCHPGMAMLHAQLLNVDDPDAYTSLCRVSPSQPRKADHADDDKRPHDDKRNAEWTG